MKSPPRAVRRRSDRPDRCRPAALPLAHLPGGLRENVPNPRKRPSRSARRSRSACVPTPAAPVAPFPLPAPVPRGSLHFLEEPARQGNVPVPRRVYSGGSVERASGVRSASGEGNCRGRRWGCSCAPRSGAASWERSIYVTTPCTGALDGLRAPLRQRRRSPPTRGRPAGRRRRGCPRRYGRGSRPAGHQDSPLPTPRTSRNQSGRYARGEILDVGQPKRAPRRTAIDPSCGTNTPQRAARLGDPHGKGDPRRPR
jgi:hypothetical protein